MSKALKPFNEEAKCPKCDGDDLNTIWLPKRDERRYGKRYNYNAPEEECIKRMCERCRFEWYEACKK